MDLLVSPREIGPAGAASSPRGTYITGSDVTRRSAVGLHLPLCVALAARNEERSIELRRSADEKRRGTDRCAHGMNMDKSEVPTIGRIFRRGVNPTTSELPGNRSLVRNACCVRQPPATPKDGNCAYTMMDELIRRTLALGGCCQWVPVAKRRARSVTVVRHVLGEVRWSM